MDFHFENCTITSVQHKEYHDHSVDLSSTNFGEKRNDSHVKELVPVADVIEENNANCFPREKDYAAVVEWLKQEKAAGRDYYKDARYNRSKMCVTLSRLFGWYVDQNSLGKQQNKA